MLSPQEVEQFYVEGVTKFRMPIAPIDGADLARQIVKATVQLMADRVSVDPPPEDKPKEKTSKEKK